MHRYIAGLVAGVATCLAAPSIVGSRGDVRAAVDVRARRLEQNPLITPRMAASLGDNINGPSVIRVPPWVDKPLGRYYMYFGWIRRCGSAPRSGRSRDPHLQLFSPPSFAPISWAVKEKQDASARIAAVHAHPPS